MANMMRQDAVHGNGFIFLDPHGDAALSIHESLSVPHIYWDIADPECAYGYNPLTRVSSSLRPLVTSALIETFKQRWSDAWGAKMENILRYAILVLLEQSQTDLRDIMRLLLDKEYRRSVVAQVTDPYVLQFWRKEFPTMNYKGSVDGVPSIGNKLGALLAHPVVRKSLCEPAMPLRFRSLMDEGAIVIVNLAKGKMGADISNVIGSVILSSVMHAGFSRYDIVEAQRRPFGVYVDEFPSFASGVFGDMIAEIRKYAIYLIIAAQYTEQIDLNTREAIWGNIATQCLFRLGATDAAHAAKQFHNISPIDFMNLPNYSLLMRLMIDGQRSQPFTATTVSPTST